MNKSDWTLDVKTTPRAMEFLEENDVAWIVQYVMDRSSSPISKTVMRLYVAGCEVEVVIVIDLEQAIAVVLLSSERGFEECPPDSTYDLTTKSALRSLKRKSLGR